MPSTLPKLEGKNLKSLYDSGKSMTEISSILKVSPNKVVYWMKKFNIKRRTHSQAAYIKQNPEGDPFKIKTNLSKNDIFLYGLGIGIYWGEGNKNPKIPSLRVANTDPHLIRIFLRFLEDIYGLNKNRFSYSIVSFNDADPEVARSYWAKELKIPPEKFGKITIIPKQGKGTYKKKSQFGVCTVQGNNSKLRRLVINKVEEIKKIYNLA
jgi:hypothetical protein